MHSESLDSYSALGNTNPSAVLLSLQKPFKIKEFIVYQKYFQITFFRTFNLIVRKAFGFKKTFILG